MVNGILLVVANVWDQVVLNREERERPGSQLEEVMEHEPLRIQGMQNFLLLGAIVAIVYASGRGHRHRWTRVAVRLAGRPDGGGRAHLVLLDSERTTTSTTASTSVRSSRSPCSSPACFITMGPALLILNARAASSG